MKFLLFAMVANAARFLTRDAPIDGQYIVVFKKNLGKDAMTAHKEVATFKNVQIARHYSIGELFNGYSARMDQDSLNYLLDQPEIDYIEQDGMAHASDYFKTEEVPSKNEDVCATQEGATWGLVRTSEVELNINGKYNYDKDGTGAYAFVLDTGIYVEHNDFNGRASWGANFVDSDNTDGNGHGTHCAGTIGGTKYGLAKKCRLVAVKVLSAGGSGSWSGVIDGINYVANDARRPATINLSLGGGFMQSVNDAVDAATNHGRVTVVAAAGNNNGDTCQFSPASAPTAIAVGATDNMDRKASFSNHGKCMNLFAPGAAVTSTWIGNPDADNTISGTSMASPHVCGIATKYLGTRPEDAPAVVKAWILQAATGNLVTGVPANTANLLLNDMCTSMKNTTTIKLSKRYM